jgi:hypothetical protein
MGQLVASGCSLAGWGSLILPVRTGRFQSRAALAQLSPRTIKAAHPAARSVPRQDVRVGERIGATVTRPLHYCAQRPPEIDRVLTMVRMGYPQYANYHDGSYMLYARIKGPDGASP